MESRVQPPAAEDSQAQAPAEGACGLNPDERKSVIDALLQEIDKTQKWTRLVSEMQAEIARLRLTDAEREALHHVVGDVADITGPVEDTIRGLLERMPTNHDAGRRRQP